MKKLKSKVFFTISTILTIFVLAVFLISNARTYSEKKENVKNVLDKMIELSDNTNSNNVFMDFTVYNIILDENGMYKETVSHTYEDVIDIVKIKNIANKIIKYHHSKYYIGNLYNAKYSYAFTDNNSLILMDNSEVKNTLTKTLITTSIIFIFLESCVILTSFILTSWITEPVSESFEKQKRFIADASHELKTPLTVINASVEAYYNDKNEKWIHNNSTTPCSQRRRPSQKPAPAKAAIKNLSGGNQQKVILGRWLLTDPQVQSSKLQKLTGSRNTRLPKAAMRISTSAYSTDSCGTNQTPA